MAAAKKTGYDKDINRSANKQSAPESIINSNSSVKKTFKKLNSYPFNEFSVTITQKERKKKERKRKEKKKKVRMKEMNKRKEKQQRK